MSNMTQICYTVEEIESGKIRDISSEDLRAVLPFFQDPCTQYEKDILRQVERELMQREKGV